MPNTRDALQRLLALVPAEIDKIDGQIHREDREEVMDEWGGVTVTVLGQQAGPWVCVDFADGQKFAIWKETGAIYRVGADGAVEEEPYA